jgi:hypothetical protein
MSAYRIQSHTRHKSVIAEVDWIEAGEVSAMSLVAAMLVVASWRNLFEILTYQVLLAQVTPRPP